jgi:hypothetical protein
MQTVIHLALCLSVLMEAGTGRGWDGMGEFMCMLINLCNYINQSPIKIGSTVQRLLSDFLL